MTRFCTCTGGLVSSLELRRKRRQVAKAFCNTCGRLLVDGIGPKSASMLGTVDIELTKFINPDLTWKRVRKGHRSASRRSRMPASSLDMGVQPDDNSPKRADDSSVSESEKLGVAVLGRRFAEKVEHVPIKKRRLFLHSPSPPSRTSSPHHKDSVSPQWPCPESISNERIETFNGSVAVVKCSRGVDGIVYGKLSEVTHEKIGCIDEFSGIALLAAAACNNSIDDDDDDDYVKESPAVEESLNPEVDLSVSATPLEESISSLKTDDFFQNGSVHEEKIDNGDGGTVKDFVCSDRLNWDLNTVMDAWERPSDDLAVDSEKNVANNTNHNDVKHTEKIENMEDSERATGPEASKQDKENKVQSSSDLHGNHMLVDSEETDIGTCELNGVECLKEACADSEKTRLKEKSVCTLTEHSLEPLHASADTNGRPSPVGTETPIDNPPCPGSGHILSTHVSVTCQISDTEFSLNNSNKFSPPKCKSSSPLVPFVEEVETIVRGDGKGHDEKASKADTTLIGSSLLVMPNSNGKDSTSHFGKTDSKGPCDAHDFVDFSRDGQGCMVHLENIIELRAGYESPFEDGELRDSVLYSWEENEAEWDNECVDYESDNGNSISEKVEDGKYGRRDALSLKESSHLASLKKKASGWDQLPEGCERSTERTWKVDDVSTRPVHTSDSMDVVNKCLSIREEGGSRANSGKLSHVEGPSCPDVYFRRSRSKNLDDSYSRPERGSGPYKSQMHDRSQEDDQWVGSSAGCRDSRNRYSSSFHRYDRGPTRPSSIIANSAAKVDRLAFRDSRKSMNYSLEGVDRPLGRRRSPIPARDMSRIRSQGRSRIYHEPISDDPAFSSVHVPLASRERSFSPVQRRVAHFSRPRRRSRSRSRTPSPLSWHFQRERNMGPIRHSRSPEFRSEARIKRMRLPIPKSSVAEDDEESFTPMSRDRFFPQFDSRWVRDRDSVADRFRGRSPVRIFRRSQRFDMVGSPGRLKSDDYFRPMRPGGPNRGTKYEYEDDIRKRGDKYEMIHRVRHDNGGNMVRRFRYDAEHTSYNEDNCIGSADRRDVYRSNRDDRGAFRYNNNNRMYNTGPKSSRIQNYDDDASARRG